MYNIRFLYYDGTIIDCQDIVKVKHSRLEGEYTEDRILTSHYPLNADYWLLSDSASYKIGYKDLKAIMTTKV